MFQDHTVPLRRPIFDVLVDDFRRGRSTVGNPTYFALILNQFVFWTERLPEADREAYLHEELQRASRAEPDGSLPQHGWIYRKLEQIVAECMLYVSDSAMRSYMRELVRLGYLFCRPNTRNPWDRTLEYRLNLAHLCRRMHECGFTLAGYRFSQLAQELWLGLHALAPDADPASRRSAAHAAASELAAAADAPELPTAPRSATVAPRSEPAAPRSATIAHRSPSSPARAPLAGRRAPARAGQHQDPRDPTDRQADDDETPRTSADVWLPVVVRWYQQITGRQDLSADDAAVLVRRHGLERVVEKLRLLELVTREGRTRIANPAAWLTAALQRDFALPRPARDGGEPCPECGGTLLLERREDPEDGIRFVLCPRCLGHVADPEEA